MLQQKPKLAWLKEGDENSKKNYQAIKARKYRGKIHSIHTSTSEWVNDREKVDMAFLVYYQELFSYEEQKQHILSTLIIRVKSLQKLIFYS